MMVWLSAAGVCCCCCRPCCGRWALLLPAGACEKKRFTKNLSQFSEISFKFPTNNGAFAFYPCMVTIQNEILPTIKQHRCKHTVKWWKLTFQQSTNNFYPYFIEHCLQSGLISDSHFIPACNFSLFSTLYCQNYFFLFIVETFVVYSYIHAPKLYSLINFIIWRIVFLFGCSIFRLPLW